MRWNLKEAGCGEPTNPRANLWSDGQKSHIRLYMRVSLLDKGVKLHPTLCGFPLSNKKLVNPIFEIVQQYDGVVIVHGSADLYNCPLEFDRMARRFPQVPLIMAHCGFFWEWELAIEVAMENDNLYLETSRVPGFETNKIIQKLGGDKVIWGTDGPFCDYEWEFNKIRRYANGEKEFDKIMGGTILSLLKD